MNCKCSAPTAPGVWLCVKCADSLGYELARVDAVVGDLRPLVPRLTLTASYGGMGGAKALHAPAPVNVSVVSVLHDLRRWLMGTSLRLAEVTRAPIHDRSEEGLASYLLAGVKRIVTLSWSPELQPQLAKILHEGEQAARTAAQQEYAGTCQEDGTQLFTTAGSNRARCQTCGTEYEAIQEWRDGAKAYARQQDDNLLGYPDALSQRLARIHGVEVGGDYIRVLASRGLLERANPERGQDGRKLRALYRLGDIKNLLNQTRKTA